MRINFVGSQGIGAHMEALQNARNRSQTLSRGARTCVARLLLALFAMVCLIGLYTVAIAHALKATTVSWWQAVKAYDDSVKNIKPNKEGNHER